jgi:hypothetical protein
MKHQIYLDFNASTPLAPVVLAALKIAVKAARY